MDAADHVFGQVDLPDLKSSIQSGAGAGLAGGVAMIIALALSYNSAGSSPFLPMQVMVHEVTGSAGFAASPLGVVSALALLLSGSAALGALFGFIVAKFVGKLGIISACGVGMIYGLLVWIISQFVVLGFLAPNVIMLYDQNALALSHAIYGICLGLLGKAYHKNSVSW